MAQIGHLQESLSKLNFASLLEFCSKTARPDRALMAKLVDAFDMMTAQETAFLGVLKNIVDIHEQATQDLAAENEAMGKPDEKKNESVEMEKKPSEKEGEKAEEGDENDEEMIRETLKELEQVSLQALAAAELNEKLVESLQRHKKSVTEASKLLMIFEYVNFIYERTSILELRKNKTDELKSAASAAMAEVKKAKQEVSANRAEIVKKQREAEELRKAALKAGIQVGAEEEKHNEEITAALAAVVNDVERIPPIPVVEEPVAPVAEPEDPLEVRRRQIRENIRKERERSVIYLHKVR
ncbi:unnamed protein product [Haemonchus placei]|uniref:Dynein regulatory complex protein 10 n=1 Tax=Haemonchus placei TaxID=6290 RepID=A0A0N4XAS8_HAEPC|nr:unnamed protein product [Haemonchus placei]